MINDDDLFILNPDEFEKIEDSFLIVEKDTSNNFLMELSVNFSDKLIYNLFAKKTTGKKQTDNSKLIFLSFLNFPDGVYVEVNPTSIKCHIFELKKSPISKMSLISKQFLSAKFHLISLFSIMNIDITDVEFMYYVAFVNDLEKRDTYNLSHPKKVVPGKSVSYPKHIQDWLKSELEINVGKHLFKERFIKLHLDKKNTINNIDHYKKEATLS